MKDKRLFIFAILALIIAITLGVFGVVELDASKEREIKQKLNNLTVSLSAVVIEKTEAIRF